MARPTFNKMLRISGELNAAVKQRAEETGHSQNVVMEHALCVAFGVPFEPPESPDGGGWPRKGAEKLRRQRARKEAP